MRDPAEGVDTRGHVTTGVGAHPIPQVFRAVVNASVRGVAGALGADLHSVYVYGSVATGQAVRGRSDLDLVVVAACPPDRLAAAEQDVSAAVQRVADATTVVRGIGAGTVALSELSADTEAGRVERCFLYHYCLAVRGPDLQRRMTPGAAGPELAAGFAAGILERIPRVSAGDWSVVTDASAFGRGC